MTSSCKSCMSMSDNRIQNPALIQSGKPGVAVYHQIQKTLEDEICTSMEIGDYLASEKVLALRFGVNRHTVRRAISVLVDKGYVERRHGVGCMVLNKPLTYDIKSTTKFTENIEALGHKTESKLLSIEMIKPDKNLSKKLALSLGKEVLKIETVRSVDDFPFCLISHYVPYSLLSNFDFKYLGGSLHKYLKTTYGWSLRRTSSLITAALPSTEDSRLLAMPKNIPILRVESVNVRTSDSQIIEFSVTRFRADKMELKVTPNEQL